MSEQREQPATDDARAGGAGEPMSAERAAMRMTEMRERWEAHVTGRVTSTYGSERFRQWINHVADDEAALLAEVDRLRAELTAARDEQWQLIRAYNERGDLLAACERRTASGGPA